MPQKLDEAVSKCMRSVIQQGKSPDKAKSICIGRLKKTGHIKRKGAGLKLTEKGKKMGSDEKK